MATRKKKSGGGPRPDGELRRSQMVTTYGPGAMVDLVHDAVLIPGLEQWRYTGAAGYRISEDRLAANLRHRGLELSRSEPFRSPPVLADDEPHHGCGLGAVEFPNWFVCPKKGCDQLLHKRDTQTKGGRRVHRCRAGKAETRLVPVRFVTACPSGHLADFPWVWFAHKEGQCSTPSLRLVDGGSGDISEVWVRCDCGQGRPMSDARGERALGRCLGFRPWLGLNATDPAVQEKDCEHPQRLLLRTASDAYFSMVESALSIPTVSGLPAPVGEFLGTHHETSFRKLTSAAGLEAVRPILPIFDDAPKLAKYSTEELWHFIETYRKEQSGGDASAHVRETEYVTIVERSKTEQLDAEYEQSGRDTDFLAVRPKPGSVPLPDGVDDLVLLKRLREVRVITGFSRLSAATQNIYGEFEHDARRAAPSAVSDWLPAVEIRGEGVFIALDQGRLEQWEQRDAVDQRSQELQAGFFSRFASDPTAVFPGIRFYLLHTLAHLLITQISLECGYAASAIRERIYCSAPEASRSMAGILLSTGTSGSEGTLGGLVEQGRRIGHHLTEALRRAKLCSHDPVCARQGPTQGTPGRSLLGAACHGCLFVAECSCERANHYLDRGLVAPLLGHEPGESLAFFTPPRG